MILTFPHMGTMSITLKALFDGLGASIMTPPPITKRTMELGAQHAPETVCLPFKVMLGNFIEALELGADTLVTCGGTGPCRLGYYAEIQKGILQDLGYEFEMLVIEPNVKNVVRNLRRVVSGKGIRHIYEAFRLAGAKMRALDQMEEHVRIIRPRAKRQLVLNKLFCDFIESIDCAQDILSVSIAANQALKQLDAVERSSDIEPLRVAIAGEIYVMLEPFVNLNLDRTLGEMGVEVHKTMSLTEYVHVHLIKSKQYMNGYRSILESAKPYLAHYVGGHGIKTVGCAAQADKLGVDGIIQVFPFTCMPEVIAKNILPSVSDTTGVPVLSLIFDEQSGEAGVRTRLEAYVDLLRYKRLRKCL